MATLPSWVCSLPNQLVAKNSGVAARFNVIPSSSIRGAAREVSTDEKASMKRRWTLVGIGALITSLSHSSSAFAEGVPDKYRDFVDFTDGYTYYYPSDWRDFDFLGHDSAFKDRFAALQHVRVGFIPTDKKDVHDLGPMEEVIFNLVKNVYAAPTQVPTIYDMQERTVDGKNYWTFEYELASPNFSRTAFATVAIGNDSWEQIICSINCRNFLQLTNRPGRYYTLIVGANERRWSRVRNKLKVVADSFKILDI